MAIFTSGMLPVQYRKFCEAANLGVLGDKSIAEMQKTYGEVVEKLIVTSQDDALLEEMAATSLKCEGVAEGIDILTDARHCWRKNARFSDIVCIGDKTHKVLKVETVSKEDKRCSQKHELLGVSGCTSTWKTRTATLSHILMITMPVLPNTYGRSSHTQRVARTPGM